MTVHADRSHRVSFPHRVTFSAYDGGMDRTAYRSAVSLHAHTWHSREVMAHLPRYIARIPLVAGRFERELRDRSEREGYPVDFSKGWWHPPVTPREVFESEAGQIERRFGLSPLVSITDHDSIAAGLELQLFYASRRAPISFEWTVPYGEGYFHLGVHNLPSFGASAWFTRLEAFTAAPEREPLAGVLADLNAERGVLIVLNHPCWDLANVGAERHAALLDRFLHGHRRALHAVELNGYRSRRENQRARLLAAALGMPIISGGDRHGCAPNALLNLTAAQSFGEFAAEIRSGVSHVVAMPEYRQPIVTRRLASASDVLRRYPSFPAGRQHWTDRVSCDTEGTIRPLSFHWPDGGPFWVRSSVKAFQLLTSPAVLPVLRVALETVDRSPADEGAASA